MKYRIGDDIVELEPTGSNVAVGSDRLYVQTATGKKSAVVIRDGRSILVSFDGRSYRLDPVERVTGDKSGSTNASGELRSLIPGVVVAVPGCVGEAVAKGATVVVLEAMKTQQPLLAPFNGVITAMNVALGDRVGENALLAVVSPKIEGEEP